MLISDETNYLSKTEIINLTNDSHDNSLFLNCQVELK